MWCTPLSTGLCSKKSTKNKQKARHWWLKPVILAVQETEIRRITVQCQPTANSSQDLISKKPITKKEWQSDSGVRAPA
jgi:hypothetical protein